MVDTSGLEFSYDTYLVDHGATTVHRWILRGPAGALVLHGMGMPVDMNPGIESRGSAGLFVPVPGGYLLSEGMFVHSLTPLWARHEGAACHLLMGKVCYPGVNHAAGEQLLRGWAALGYQETWLKAELIREYGENFS